jgi:hypothetical protein
MLAIKEAHVTPLKFTLWPIPKAMTAVCNPNQSGAIDEDPVCMSIGVSA